MAGRAEASSLLEALLSAGGNDAFSQMAQTMRSGTNPITGRSPTTEDYVRFYANSSPDPWHQFLNIIADRRRMDRLAAETNTPRDLNMRNAEHAFVTQTEINRPWGRSPSEANSAELPGAYPFMGATVPIYSLLKLLGQTTGLGYRDSTPPSWEEVKWGLAPFWGGIPAHADLATAGPLAPQPRQRPAF